MKDKLESDLITIANRIIKLEGKGDVVKMHTEVRELYEKLSVLKFAEENFEEDIPKIGNNSSFFGMLDSAFNNKVSDNIEVEDRIYINYDEREDDGIMEPAIEKIKNMVEHMPNLEDQVDDVFDKVPLEEKDVREENLDDLIQDFKDMPEFEPVSKVKEKHSLNDKINKGKLSIGLNDKIAFIKHLFDGQTEDYNRVISQLNTLTSLEESKHFIEHIVKPDYNGWLKKEEFEERFIYIIESKFN